MKYKRVMIAATGSGTGKTTITCGLLAALKNAGMKPCSFKCGPDYIDPMFHRNVIGVASGNLDTFFTDADTTKRLFVDEYDGDIALIEGVMGLYDGIGGTSSTGSSYDLARVLDIPIVLVVNGRGMGRSILAEIKGFLDYDEHHLIKAVILNRVSKSFGNTLTDLIEKELGIKVIGCIENCQDVSIDSRHLGLVLPNEIETINEKLSIVASIVEAGVDIEGLKKISEEALDININAQDNIVNTKRLRLAVARDEAFCFYYKENLRMLEKMGVELLFFSPIHDKKLPDDIEGILLGGGYPENFLKELSINVEMKASIKNAINSGMPIIAECGGFMYLLDSIVGMDNKSYQMVGALNGSCTFKGKLVRFGYVTIEKENTFFIKGHEFHYYDTDNNGEDLVITKASTGKSMKAMHYDGKLCVGFPHLYYPSSPDFVENFLEAMREYGK